jgi:hypothetical protein
MALNYVAAENNNLNFEHRDSRQNLSQFPCEQSSNATFEAVHIIILA